jgi:hypothetical protein
VAGVGLTGAGDVAAIVGAAAAVDWVFADPQALIKRAIINRTGSRFFRIFKYPCLV